jgi:hypothetical protein
MSAKRAHQRASAKGIAATRPQLTARSGDAVDAFWRGYLIVVGCNFGAGTSQLMVDLHQCEIASLGSISISELGFLGA